MIIAAAAALLLAAPTNAPVHMTEERSAPMARDVTNKAPGFGELMKMFDKMFPAQPEPEPARLALARQSAEGLLPSGTYGRMMTGFVDSLANSILNLSEAEFGGKGRKGKPASTETLRESILKDDPHFDERMTIIRRVASDEMGKLSAILEPRMRDGVARSMARRFDAKQLSDLNAFLATDSGKAFGQQSMAMWIDPDVMRSIVGAMPDLITAMPAVIQRIDKETAHLPKPKKTKKAEEPKEKAD